MGHCGMGYSTQKSFVLELLLLFWEGVAYHKKNMASELEVVGILSLPSVLNRALNNSQAENSFACTLDVSGDAVRMRLANGDTWTAPLQTLRTPIGLNILTGGHESNVQTHRVASEFRRSVAPAESSSSPLSLVDVVVEELSLHRCSLEAVMRRVRSQFRSAVPPSSEVLRVLSEVANAIPRDSTNHMEQFELSVPTYERIADALVLPDTHRQTKCAVACDALRNYLPACQSLYDRFSQYAGVHLDVIQGSVMDGFLDGDINADETEQTKPSIAPTDRVANLPKQEVVSESLPAPACLAQLRLGYEWSEFDELVSIFSEAQSTQVVLGAITARFPIRSTALYREAAKAYSQHYGMYDRVHTLLEGFEGLSARAKAWCASQPGRDPASRLCRKELITWFREHKPHADALLVVHQQVHEAMVRIRANITHFVRLCALRICEV